MSFTIKRQDKAALENLLDVIYELCQLCGIKCGAVPEASFEFDDSLVVDSEAEQKIIMQEVAAVNQTCGELVNLTRSMGFAVRGADGRLTFKPAAKAYQSALDKAHMLVASGGMDYITAVRMAVGELASSGVRFVDYDSGVRNHADVAVRRAVLTGVSQMTGQIALHNAAELGTDVVEVDAHAGARPDHAVWQGRWFSLTGKDKRYPLLSQATGYGTVTGLKGANCRHDFYPVIPGIDEPAYTEEELRNIDPPPVTVDGKTYTYYEAEQRQREIERAIRKTKRQIIAAQASGDEEQFTAKSVLLRRQRTEYKEFSDKAGLIARNERTQVYGYGRSVGSKAGWAARKAKASTNAIYKMAANNNDWSKTVPQTHTAEEIKEITEYAKKRGIKLFNPQTFDGDIEMLRQQIETVFNIKTEYNVNQKITLKFTKLNDNDFAITENYTITFNNKALRNIEITNMNFNSDDYLAGTECIDIATHEMGHILSRYYGYNGLDIARKAYYNVNGRYPSLHELTDYLENCISTYSTEYGDAINGNDIPIPKRKYKEIVSEILVASRKFDDDPFVEEFIKIMKEVI